MKALFMIFILVGASAAHASDFYQFKMKSSKGKEIDFSSFRGKPTLVVNIATKCGYTPQLEGLEKLSQKYRGKLNVVGVPSNDFGSQTPEKDEGVEKFCRLNYGVSFPLTTKSVVKGKDKISLIKFLVASGNDIRWNFEKFLVDGSGKVSQRFASSVAPMSDELVKQIEKLLE